MKTKVLQVFYNENGLPFKDQERTVHFPIVGSGFMGASNTTQIKFYFKEIGDDAVKYVAVSKLPNGKVGSKVLENYFDTELNEPYALLELDSYYTQYKGDVFISLQGYQGGVQVTYDEDTELYEIEGTPTIQATGSIKFTNNYATQFVGSDEEQNVTLQQLLAIISDTVLRYNVTSANTLAEVFNEIGTKICVLNVEGDEYLCEMSGDTNIVLYDIHNQEWYAFTGVSSTDIDTVLQDSNKQIIATKEDLENFGNLFIYKGAASVAQINALTDIENGWCYNLTDSGTLTLGNLQVEQGDNVAFDGTVWTKLSSETVLGNYYTKQEGQAFENDIDERVDAVENQVQQVASGSPKGVYATLAALQAAYPTGAEGIYLVSANGHWYYWNGSDWTDGGTYLSSALDSQLSYTSNNGVQNKQITDAISFAQEETNDLVGSSNLFDLEKNSFDSLTVGFLDSDGSIATSLLNYLTTDFIFLKAGTYTFKPTYKLLSAYNTSWQSRMLVCMYSLNKKKSNEIGAYTNIDRTNKITFTMLKDGYVRLCFHRTIIAEDERFYAPILCKGSSVVLYGNYYCKSKDDNSEIIEHSENLLTTSEYVDGAYINFDGRLIAYDPYITTGYIQLKANHTYSIKGTARFVWFLGVDGTTTTYLENQTNTQFTPTIDGYLVLSIGKDYINDIIVVESSTMPTSYIEPNYVLKNNIKVKPENIGFTSVLYGKKYVVCGDSFSSNSWTESDTPEYIEDGKYKGKLKIYPYIIGNRTNANIVQMAAGGMTLATKSGLTNCFTYNNYYKSIPADADYITIYLGINDSNNSIPIGTIDDTTTDTFYGAWNVVLEWLITNRPNAHIGIIISNGTGTSTYPTATINICKKWGVAYLDINGDDKLPYVIRATMRTDLSATARAIYDSQYRVSETNTHPNGLAHEKESYMIQQFLERI